MTLLGVSGSGGSELVQKWVDSLQSDDTGLVSQLIYYFLSLCLLLMRSQLLLLILSSSSIRTTFPDLFQVDRLTGGAPLAVCWDLDKKKVKNLCFRALGQSTFTVSSEANIDH